MTTPQDSTNTTERDPRSSGSPPDEPRRASGPEKQGTMPPRRSWLWFALILLANFLLVMFILPDPRSVDRGALHLLQGAGQGGESRGDLQPGRHCRGPLRGTGHLPTQRTGWLGAFAHLQELHHRAPLLRGPRSGEGFDR